MTVVLFIWGGNYSLLHLFIWNAPGALWWIREKHSNFHHTCTFSNPKETSLRAARCPKDDLYLGEQLRPPLSIHSLAQSLRARVCDVVNSIKILQALKSPAAINRTVCVEVGGQRLDLLWHSCTHRVKLVLVQSHPTFTGSSSWTVTQCYRLSTVSITVSVPVDHW